MMHPILLRTLSSYKFNADVRFHDGLDENGHPIGDPNAGSGHYGGNSGGIPGTGNTGGGNGGIKSAYTNPDGSPYMGPRSEAGIRAKQYWDQVDKGWHPETAAQRVDQGLY